MTFSLLPAALKARTCAAVGVSFSLCSLTVMSPTLYQHRPNEKCIKLSRVVPKTLIHQFNVDRLVIVLQSKSINIILWVIISPFRPGVLTDCSEALCYWRFPIARLSFSGFLPSVYLDVHMSRDVSRVCIWGSSWGHLMVIRKVRCQFLQKVSVRSVNFKNHEADIDITLVFMFYYCGPKWPNLQWLDELFFILQKITVVFSRRLLKKNIQIYCEIWLWW